MTQARNSTSPDKNASSLFLAEAVELCKRQFEQPDNLELENEIAVWRRQSLEHERCWQQAQQYWRAAGQIRRPSGVRSLTYQLSLRVSIWKARIPSWRQIPVFRPQALALFSLCLLVIPGSLFWFNNHKATSAKKPAVVRSITSEHYRQEYSSQARHRTVHLPDGSVLTLNWHTRATVEFSADTRLVQLHAGEALFDVVHNPRRPFTVTVGQLTATAVGTQFSVNTMENGSMRVTVAEGLVDVRSPALAEPMRLQLNQQVQAGTSSVGIVSTVDATSEMAWQHGMLQFHDSPLSEVLEELDRYSIFQVVPGSLDAPEQTVTGTYFTDRADDALSLIAAAFNLQLRRDGNRIVVDSAPPRRPQ